VRTRTRPITVAETAVFMRQASVLWTDDERLEFVDFIARNPEAGDLIPGGSGVRKVRWSRKGSGKRGGVRVIYFYHDPAMPLYLLMIYAKARRDDLSPDARRTVQGLAERLKAAYGR
jgi:mRNA-degrading endonuclease RelE of RelBE toxin-antitoxin system